jgi:Helix-turn-helix domain
MAEQLEGRLRFHDDHMVTVADAARIAQRSVRTIRRAYLSGRLVAHRDANGRRITIRYGDLRDWLLAAPVTPPPDPSSSDLVGVEARKRSAGPAATGNLELLAAARQRRARRARVSASARPYRDGTDSTST